MGLSEQLEVVKILVFHVYTPQRSLSAREIFSNQVDKMTYIVDKIQFLSLAILCLHNRLNKKYHSISNVSTELPFTRLYLTY